MEATTETYPAALIDVYDVTVVVVFAPPRY